MDDALDAPVTLVGDSSDEVAEAQRQMAGIGIDRQAAAVTGGLGAWAAGGEVPLRLVRAA